MSGYSDTPLAKKLGLRDGMAALLVAVPETVGEVRDFPGFASLETALNSGPRDLDYVHVFSSELALLADALPVITSRLKHNAMLWISWPKKASKVRTDITEDRLRDLILPCNLVDVKVCAVDDIWSGLKFMWRTEHRSTLV